MQSLGTTLRGQGLLALRLGVLAVGIAACTDSDGEGRSLVGVAGAAAPGPVGTLDPWQCSSNPDTVDLTTPISGLGFSAQQVLDANLGSRDTSLTWKSGTSPMAARLELVSGLDDAIVVSGHSGGCPTMLQVGVAGRIATWEGEFVTEFQGKLLASSLDFAVLTVSTPTTNARGSAVTELPMGPMDRLEMAAVVSNLGTAGYVKVTEVQANGGVTTAAPRLVASWPDQTCLEEYSVDPPGVPVGPEAVVGATSVAEQLEVFTAVRSATIRWNDSTSATLELSAAPSGKECAHFVLGREPTLRYRAQVSIHTSDDAVNGEYPGEVEIAEASSPSLVAALAARDVEGFANRIGMPGLSLNGYDGASFRLVCSLDEAGKLTGELSVSGEISGENNTDVVEVTHGEW